MSLVRWSSSPWYIYDVGEKEIAVECHGHYTLVELANLEQVVADIGADSNYSKRDLLELKLYLKTWSDINSGHISRDTFRVRLEQLRHISNVNYYLKYGILPSEWTTPSYKEKIYHTEFYSRKQIKANPNLMDKEKVVLKEYGSNGMYEITIIDPMHYSYRNKNMLLEIKKITKRTKFLFENEPLIVGETYTMSFDNMMIFNSSKRENKEYKQEKLKLINSKISSLTELRDKLLAELESN